MDIMDNHMLTKVNSIKYLGIIVDHKLNWIDHITYVKAKISKGIGIMYKARRHLNKHSLRNLYYAYIYPYLTYCVEVWGCASKCQLNSLFLVQKKILRIMTFSPYLAHTDPLFKGLKILPVNKLYIDRIGIISGVSRISFRGGFKFFLEKWEYLHGAKRHAARGKATRLLGGFGGMLPREIFLKWCNLVCFREYFAKNVARKII